MIDMDEVRRRCDLGFWQAAYGAAGLCRGKDDATWKQAADYIEQRKAEVLRALIEQWRSLR